MCKKLIYLFIAALALCWIASTAPAGVSYPNPPGGWTYIYNGDTAGNALDGKWDHDNGSDSYDGSDIGTGNYGGIGALLDGSVNFIRMQDPGDPRDHAQTDPTNRRLYLTHDLRLDGVSQAVADQILTGGGITITFRARLATGAPIDAMYPDTAGGSELNTTPGGTAWPAGGNGYVTYSDGKGVFGVQQVAGGTQVISFALSLATDDTGTNNELQGRQGLTMNKRNGTVPSATVDLQGDEGIGTAVVNILEVPDLTSWHEFWITILPDTSGGGTHKVLIYRDGLLTANEFHVTSGTGGEETYSTIILGMGATPQMGALDVDFFAYKPGYILPPGVPIKAWAPDPADGAVDVRPASLKWKAGATVIIAHDVYFGTDQAAIEDADTSSPEYQETTGGLEFYILTPLDALTTYFWRIDGVEEGGTTHKGDVWRFTTPSLKAYNPSPVNGATRQDPNVDLTWTRGFMAKAVGGQDVYFGTDATAVTNATTSNPLGVFKGNQSTTNYDPGTLAYNTAHYWRIDSRNTDNTTTKGDVWNFTTERTFQYIAGVVRSGSTAGTPIRALPFMEDALCFVDRTHQYNVLPPELPDLVDAEYIRTANDDKGNSAVTHQVTLMQAATIYLVLDNRLGGGSGSGQGRDPDLVAAAMTWVTAMGFADTGYDIGIDEAGDGDIDRWSSLFMAAFPSGTITLGGQTQGYGGNMYGIVATAPPTKAHNPRPRDNELIETLTVTLQWNAGFSAAATNGHKVYFSSNFDAVNNRAIEPVIRTDTSYQIPAPLQLGETYYWAVDEVNGVNLWSGDVWRFTITDYFVLEDYERYTNTSPDIISQTWIGGGGGKVGYNDPNYAEVTIVHGGRQSMPLGYNNLVPPNLSEASRTFPSPGDWTANGVKALSLWTRGYGLSVGSCVQSPPGTYTMTARGTDIWDVPDIRHPSTFHDEFHYAYTQVSGDYVIIAKVESVSNTDPWAKAGVMMRDSLDANSIHVMMCMTPGSGVAFQYRDIIAGASTNTNQTGITTPYWVAVQRTGNNFVGAYCADGASWQQLGAIDIVMADPIFVGLSLTSHNATATCTAVFSNVSGLPTFTNQDIGIMSNTKAPLYVTLQDSSNVTATVTNPDANAVINSAWQVWDIPMSSFTGINKTAIKKITVGVGNKGAPQPVGVGTIYVDDIRLYIPRCYPSLAKPLADFTNDCLVDYADLAIMTGDWLEHDSTRTGQVQLHWAFNEGAGATVSDSSGKGHTGNIYGATWAAPGYNGSGACLDFNGVGNYVLNNDVNTALNGLNGLSVCAWIRSDLDNTDKGFIIFETPIGNDSRDMRYDAAGSSGGGTNVMKVGITATDGEQLLESSGSVQKIGVWQHVAIVWASGQNLMLYIDGVPNTPTYIGATRSGTLTGYTRLMVGKGAKDTAADQGWDGLIDDVRIYDYALSQAEISSVINGQTLPPVQIYYPVLSPANIYDAEPPNSKSVNLRDYALLADTWLEEVLWPQ